VGHHHDAKHTTHTHLPAPLRKSNCPIPTVEALSSLSQFRRLRTTRAHQLTTLTHTTPPSFPHSLSLTLANRTKPNPEKTHNAASRTPTPEKESARARTQY